MDNRATLAAISYAHSPRDGEIISLADRLNREGVDCEIDVYDEAPPQGWARWMVTMMTQRTVLVVASEAYYRRYHLADEHGVGLGATFESGILVQRVLEMQGQNEGIIPLLLDSADERYIPEFLHDATRYDLSQPDGYDRLYRRLTGQPLYVKPPIGKIRDLPPLAPEATPATKTSESRVRNIALFHSNMGIFFVEAVEIERGKTLKMTLSPDDDGDVARLRSLSKQTAQFGLSFGSTAAFAKIRDYREIVRAGVQEVQIEMTEMPVDNLLGTESSFNGISADEIAEMRARRILLNEKLDSRGPGWGSRLTDSTFELFVSGGINGGNRLAASTSPIPLLASSMNVDSPEFITVSRLACVLLLILTGTVEHVVRLNIRCGPDGVDVSFEGTRPKVYSNQDATSISVVGTCPIG